MKTFVTRNVFKTKLLPAFMVMLPLGCAAENYFVDGMRWELKAFSAPAPSSQSWNVVQYLDGCDFVAGKECLKFYSGVSDENKPVPLLTYIHTDGDKVYFLALKPGEDRDNGEWTLLYDFSLVPGEQASIGYMTWYDASYNPKLRRSTATGLIPTCRATNPTAPVSSPATKESILWAERNIWPVDTADHSPGNARKAVITTAFRVYL